MSALARPVRAVQVDIRTGDTPQKERQRQARQPADILVTTPESLFLLLGSKARDNLRSVHTVIIDEIHALAPSKRGAHLALSMERLSALCTAEPQRIGLSATVRPLDEVARFLGGRREVDIVDLSAKPQLDLQVMQEAQKYGWVYTDDSETPCPPQRVRIVWDVPGDLADYNRGAYFEPLGPAPSESSTSVNGLLLCEGSNFLYRGFEAYYDEDRAQWRVYPFPVIEAAPGEE